MMEGVLNQRMTPLLKCILLFLFIFTAKVLTSRPHESQERNSIHHLKPAHYVRTFTKYHHRRTIQWNMLDYWPVTQDHHVGKRSVDVPNLNANGFFNEESSLNRIASDSTRGNILASDKTDVLSKDVVSNDVKKVTNTVSPSTITCLYKVNSMAMSVTPSYVETEKDQPVVETELFGLGSISNITLNGESVQVEQCTNPHAYCFTLLHQEKDGNVTVLGQGCWHSSQRSCNKCSPVTARLPDSKFCCCTKSYCNADYMSLKEETVTIKAESTMDSSTSRPNYSSVAAFAILAVVVVLLMALVFRKVYCKRSPMDKDDLSDGLDVEKGDVMGTGPDALATGLLCVDNLTLIEHIGCGKFGSVWRGSLGGRAVAVKLYGSAAAWQREAAIYALPHLAHRNILTFYGSDTRANLTEGGLEHLVVLELCSSTLRQRLERAPVSWLQFATLAHGLASALAHLHTPSGSKPCIVHRDVNSNNVLISADGEARLADLGLAQPLLPRRERTAPTRITEAGTLRYLSPEALEGALDLSGAGAALCAVDVFALGLVLWEMLWRCSGAPYCPPYHLHRLPPNPTLAQMQSLVSRNKARPPLPGGGGGPGGPVPEARALRVAAETCDECWDHDAEARLTAVCVEERMAELKLMLLVQGPVIHDNNLHPQPPGEPAASEPDKNSNCHQNGDVTTPLLYPHPHIGRNACIERNTHTTTQNTLQLIHKSLKDITIPADAPRVENLENCLSVARVTHHRVPENSDRLNEIRSYQRPLEYVQNDVSSHDVDRGPKQTNLLQDKTEKKWGIRKFFEKKLGKPKETEVKLVPETSNIQNGRTKTSIVDKPTNVPYDRPSNLVLNQDRTYNYEVPCTLSPPNRTLSPTMMIESEMNTDKVFKELPSQDNEAKNQIFAVIVPKVKTELKSTSKGSTESINKQSVRTSMSSQSIKAGHSESEDSTIKKRLSCDNRIISISGRSSRASINLELQYIDNQENFNNDSPFDMNSDCSSSEDEHLMLLSENDGSKITMRTLPKIESEKKKYQNDVLKEASQAKTFNKFQNKYANFDNEFSDPNDKENLVYSGENPVYFAALNGEIETDIKCSGEQKPPLKSLSIKRQHSLEQVSSIFCSSGDINLQNPAGRVKTPGDLPVAVRRARRDRALQKGRASECNRLSLYNDRMMFGNSL